MGFMTPYDSIYKQASTIGQIPLSDRGSPKKEKDKYDKYLFALFSRS